MSEHKIDKVALSPGEFAAIFGKSQTWGYRQLYSGKVKAMTGYGRIMIPASEVERVLSEAGRYLGSGKVAEKQQPKVTPKAKRTKAAERPNPWRSAIKSRKQQPGTTKREKNHRRSKLRMDAQRSSAMRKLNQK